MTVTLSNSNATALSGGAFTDTLVNMSAAGGAVGGTCTGTTPNTLSPGVTALSFTGINILANNSCTVTFSVTSTNLGGNNNTTSGVSTTQTPAAGSGSNTATLTVSTLASPTISKAFNPTTIPAGGSSTVTVTLSNSNATALSGGACEFHLARQNATQRHLVPKLLLPECTSSTGSDLPSIRGALAAARHLLEMYRRQLADEHSRHKLQRLDKRLLSVAIELDRLTTHEK